MPFACNNVSIVFRKFHLCVTEANPLKSIKNAQFICDVVLFFMCSVCSSYLEMFFGSFSDMAFIAVNRLDK